MTQAYFNVPEPKNEPYLSYAPGTPGRSGLQAELKRLSSEEVEIPLIIGGKEVRTNSTKPVVMPHNHGHKLGTLHLANNKEVNMAIEAALEARKEWAATPWQDRVAVFLKAADMLTGNWRYTINAATMLGQSKTPQQAEIEAVGELADFLRFNAHYLTGVMSDQPYSPDGMWNRVEYRPLEGFLFAVTPFNFTAIAVNLPTSMAMCGNVVVWKPATSSIYSNFFMMKLLQEAGLPDGVINFVPGSGPDVGDPVMESPQFAGLQFTGSEGTFNHLWKKTAENLDKYHSYPRIVGETGGKDFIFAHNSADVKELAVAALRGAYEYQGQKCSAASRMYVPESIWPEFKETFLAEVAKIKTGDISDFSTFMGAVIDKKAFDSITGYIDFASEADDAEIIAGGSYDDSTGYFVEPTVILTGNPHFKTMQEEIFGPVLTIYVYKDDDFEATLDLCNKTSPYGLTGAIFAKNRYVINQMSDALQDAAGNFYINDKPTAAVVNQQPFGGARKSGTNDKAGSKQNMLRWLSARAIKETHEPPKEWEYPYMG
ncbi:L-glutamate gamma-semialdehyde dehydrogenase [Natronogracilivirga saccharolytica]|uniref:L-glutamate gamma-semialdehyde dehydrogenase n=1 Tax=Natronogracilivirga saccharolytica TaxID=2812953 RepID=A0A8J7RRZ7_9BACT|nr:L-glutamate gamma-semialdehyde dehydrogenase [Natronogracilivirga saccharolytica]MBP3192704.1 L-glutamate gamma-semialdehyde dehydrogenase [Natronogracilivirga saccharolytica]